MDCFHVFVSPYSLNPISITKHEQIEPLGLMERDHVTATQHKQAEVKQGTIMSEISLSSAFSVMIVDLSKYLGQGNCLENVLIAVVNE